jgi:DNA polymerase-3 subunit chi
MRAAIVAQRSNLKMTDIRFYHLTATPLERALPQLLEKAAGAQFRVVVKAADEMAVEALNTVLWTYNPNSFLPHGSANDGNAAEQPIFLTYNNENPNNATLLAVTDGSTPPLDGYERVLDLFDGSDENAVQAARTRWKTYKDAGHTLQYWQQTESGGWTQKA